MWSFSDDEAHLIILIYGPGMHFVELTTERTGRRYNTWRDESQSLQLLTSMNYLASDIAALTEYETSMTALLAIIKLLKCGCNNHFKFFAFAA